MFLVIISCLIETSRHGVFRILINRIKFNDVSFYVISEFPTILKLCYTLFTMFQVHMLQLDEMNHEIHGNLILN